MSASGIPFPRTVPVINGFAKYSEMATHLLNLQFFNQSTSQKENESRLKDSVLGKIVATSIGSGFLFVADAAQNSVIRFDHKIDAQSVPVDLEEIEYLKASQAAPRVLAAGRVKNGYGVCMIELSDFEQAIMAMEDFKAKQIQYLPPSGTGNAKAFCASPSLNYICYVSASNDLVIFTTEVQKKIKPAGVKAITSDVTDMFITDAGTVYLSSSNGVFVYTLQTKQFTSIDSRPCAPGFSFMKHDETLAVCRGRVITFYNKAATGYEQTELDISSEGSENPVKVGFAGNYLYAIYPYNIQGAVERIRMIDPVYHVRAMTEPLMSKAAFVELQWGAILVIQEDKMMMIRTEADDKSKIEKLCSVTQFKKAIDMATDLHLPGSIIANIHQLQGDNDYESQKYDEAISEYIETLGYTEPSHVIQKFVEPHHAQNLMRYLLALQEKKLATKQHTTLLFNCYTKIRATGLLEEAVKRFVSEADPNTEPSFDVKTAVDVLKRNGYQGYAEQLAKAYGQHSLYIQLLYENQNYGAILQYMKTLPGSLVKRHLIEYGSEIMDNYPDGREELTAFAVKCCTEGIANAGPALRRGQITVIDPHELALIFVNNYALHFDFLYQVVKSPNRKSDLLESNWNVLIEMALRSKSDKVMDLLKDPEAQYSNEQVLVYLTAFGNKEGKMLIYEKMGLYTLILQEANPEQCLEICQKFGNKDRTLWSDALVKLSRADCDPAILSQFLEEVQKEDALPFLTILKVMRGAKKHSFATLLPVVQATFKKEQDLLHEAERKIQEATKRTAENKAVNHSLSTQNFVINQKVCEICHQIIDSESNHFMCGHSFHLRCLGDAGEFCRECKDKFEKILEEKRKKMENARNQKDVKGQLEAAGDGFQFLLEQVGNSLFSSGVDIMSSKQDDEELNETNQLLRKMAEQH